MKTLLLLVEFFGGLFVLFGLGYLIGVIFKLKNYIKN